MKSGFNKLFNLSLIALLFSTALSVSAQVRAYRVNDRQVNTVISRIETRTDTFRRQIERFYDRNETASREQLSNLVDDFENATDNLRSNFGSRTSTAADVQDVLNRASYIDSFMRGTRVPANVQTQWNLLRTDLTTLAGYYNIRWNWNTVPSYPGNTQGRSYRVNDSQVQSLISRLETRTDTFRRQIDRFDTRFDSQLEPYVTTFENATDELRNNFNSRNSTSEDVREVLTSASVIDRFVRDNRVTASTRSQWNLIRSDLDLLANYYTVSWNWNNVPNYPTYPGNTGQTAFDSRLTGTYRLNTSLSDNVNTVIDRAILTLGNNANQRERMRRNLERRLMAPDSLVIEKRGQEITLASSMSQQVSFNADGTLRTETNPNGRSVQIRSTATNSDLTINYEGDRMNDFYVRFMPMANGQLRVTRRVYLENRNETVTVNSVYDKIDQIARFDNVRYQDGYPIGSTNGNTTGTTYNDQFVIPNNTRLVATLDTNLSTRTFQDGDRFQMTVSSPSEFQGAIIEGRVNGQKSGVVSGRASLAFDFDTIRLRDGRTYRFAGIVDQVREPDGDVVSVNNEGQVRDSNQTTKTVTRAGIGAALGAIIGAIAGGGQGAVIGATVGAGAGAGSVVLQGRDNLELPTGTEFSITATAPSNR